MKKIVALVAIILMMFMFTGCNKTVFDTTYRFDRAIIKLPNGDIVQGAVDTWTDFEDGDSIQVKIAGKTYLTHISNVVLIDD